MVSSQTKALVDERSSLLPRDKRLDWTEAGLLARRALPALTAYVLQFSLQIASVFSLGHLGKAELAASALASMYAVVTGWSIAFGAGSALDTLCSQAYTSGNPKLVGVYLQRGVVAILCCFVLPFMSVTWWESERILVHLGQDPEIAALSGLFLRHLLIGAPAFVMFDYMRKFLQAQENMRGGTFVLMIVSPINIVLNYVLVWYKPLSLGFVGAPLATSISYWLMFFLMILYIRYIDGMQAWGGWSRACLSGWGSFFRLAIPGTLMVCTEWWAYELVALAAGTLGSLELAAQSVVMTTVSLSYQFPFGVAISASNRVGNLLGEGSADRARMASRMAMVIAVMIALVNTVVMMLFKSSWGRIFSDDDNVVALVATILPLCAAFQLSDCLGAVGGGILRGLGKQKIGAVLNLTGYYGVAIPLGMTLAFPGHMGLKGLWVGLIVASALVEAGILYTIWTTNWETEKQRVLRAMHQANLEVDQVAGGYNDPEGSNTPDGSNVPERNGLYGATEC